MDNDDKNNKAGQTSAPPVSTASPANRRPRAPTLYIIIVGKLIKGTLALGLAFGVFKLAGRDLSHLFDQFVHWIHLDPENRFFSEIGDKLDGITAANVHWIAFVTFIYSLFSLVEGIGLIFRASWAGWLAIGESAFFIPIEVRELILRPHWFVASVLAFNILIVWYLFVNRGWLFRHHQN
jgi:uncharacterized membrane protein (DUF2068 family)